jgi:hypothetical protein
MKTEGQRVVHLWGSGKGAKASPLERLDLEPLWAGGGGGGRPKPPSGPTYLRIQVPAMSSSALHG